MRPSTVDTADDVTENEFQLNERSKSKEYIDRMKEGQNDINDIIGESIAVESSSPFLENLRKKGLEVSYLMDTVDEYAVHQLKDFHGKKPVTTTEEGLDLHDMNVERYLSIAYTTEMIFLNFTQQTTEVERPITDMYELQMIPPLNSTTSTTSSTQQRRRQDPSRPGPCCWNARAQ